MYENSWAWVLCAMFCMYITSIYQTISNWTHGVWCLQSYTLMEVSRKSWKVHILICLELEGE